MCLQPLSIKSQDAFGCEIMQTVPCGKCVECLKNRQNSWKIRLIEEARDHLYVYFFTLTYNESSVPVECVDGEDIKVCRKSDVQSWIKRNRIAYQRLFKRDIDFKYFICSEYGPNTGRPHYHGIFFTDISPTFISSMFADWSQKFGFVNFSQVGQKGKKKVSRQALSSVSNYVAKYCLKPDFLNTPVQKKLNDLFNQGLIPRPFYLMSKGLGASYVDKMMRYHVPFKGTMSSKNYVKLVVDRSCYHDATYSYKLPRYYKDRFYRKKYPKESRVWNPKTKQYETKTVYRFLSKNLLALQMQDEIRSRVLAEYHRFCSEARTAYPGITDPEIDVLFCRHQESIKRSKQKDISSKMSRFYNSNRFEHRKL